MTHHWNEILSDEHRLMEKVLTVITVEAEKLSVGGQKAKDSQGRVTRSLEFFEVFMDKCHNVKEEKVLFPKLEQKGIPKDGGPIGAMLLEHQKEREFLKTLRSCLDRGDTRRAQSESNGFAELVKDHVWKEDEVLYPMGKKVLNENEASKLVTGFDAIENELGKGVHEKYHEIAESLIKEMGAAESLIKNLSPEVLSNMLDTIPMEITFIDADDTLRYFNKENEKKYFARPRVAIGRKVQKCHPEKSIRSVNQLLADLRSGKKNVAESWIDVKGRKVHIRYFAVRNRDGHYLGTMEVVQDITEIKKIEGEKRIVK